MTSGFGCGAPINLFNQPIQYQLGVGFLCVQPNLQNGYGLTYIPVAPLGLLIRSGLAFLYTFKISIALANRSLDRSYRSWIHCVHEWSKRSMGAGRAFPLREDRSSWLTSGRSHRRHLGLRVREPQ